MDPFGNSLRQAAADRLHARANLRFYNPGFMPKEHQRVKQEGEG
jgi:hypothetical protein